MNNSSQSLTMPQDGASNMASVVFLSVAVPLAVIANSLVIEVVRRKRNNRKTNDMFILNLAVSDLLFGLFLTPDIYDLFVKSPPTLLYCKILPPFQTFTYFLSVYTLVSMAIERQYVILNPFKPRIRSRWLKIWLLMIWFSSLICVAPIHHRHHGWKGFVHRELAIVQSQTGVHRCPLCIAIPSPTARHTLFLCENWNIPLSIQTAGGHEFEEPVWF